MDRCELNVEKPHVLVHFSWRVGKSVFIQIPYTDKLGIIFAPTVRVFRQEMRCPRCPRHSYSSSLNLIFLLIIDDCVRFVEIPLIFDYVSKTPFFPQEPPG